MGDNELENTPRGIFTERDRKYLLGKKGNIGDSHERVIRNAIRERVDYSFRDLAILWNHLDPEDREKAFDPVHQEFLRYAVAFVFSEVSKIPTKERYFERAIVDGIKDGATEQGLFADVSLDIDLHDENPEEILDKAERGDATFEEVTWLYRLDHIDVEDMNIKRHE